MEGQLTNRISFSFSKTINKLHRKWTKNAKEDTDIALSILSPQKNQLDYWWHDSHGYVLGRKKCELKDVNIKSGKKHFNLKRFLVIFPSIALNSETNKRWERTN